MSKIGIAARLTAILHNAERINPMAARVYRLPPALRTRYDMWRAQCDAIHDRYEREGGPGASYAAYLETGESITPEPPRAVAEALQIDRTQALTDDMTARDMADTWKGMVED